MVRTINTPYTAAGTIIATQSFNSPNCEFSAIAGSYLDSSPSTLTILVIGEDTKIPDSNLVILHPIPVEVQITDDGYLIKSSYVDEEAFGITLDFAYNDFLTSLRDRLHSLLRRKERLSNHDKLVLERLQQLIIP